MGETSDQIERHIQETRNDLGDNLNELEDRVKTAVDWRAQFEERPGTMLALAFGGGILLSALLPTVRSSRRKTSEGRGNASADQTAGRLSAESHTVFDDRASQALEGWDALKGALVGVATSKLSGLIEDLLPGFKQEFTKAQNGRDSAPSGRATSGPTTWQESSAAEAN